MSAARYRFRGVDRAGHAQGGMFAADLGGFVLARFRRGWRQLVVVPVDSDGREGDEVAGISGYTGRRTYWLEP